MYHSDSKRHKVKYQVQVWRLVWAGGLQLTTVQHEVLGVIQGWDLLPDG